MWSQEPPQVFFSKGEAAQRYDVSLEEDTVKKIAEKLPESQACLYSSPSHFWDSS